MSPDPSTESIPEPRRAKARKRPDRKEQGTVSKDHEPESGATKGAGGRSSTRAKGVAEPIVEPEVSGGPMPSFPERPDGHRNEVHVVGRVTAAPAEKELPSGDRLVTWRIGVARPEVPGPRRARVDSLTLVSFDPHMCDRVHGWRVGDVVRVTGELRRRFWRGWNGVRSVLEVEVDTAVLVRRAQG